MDSFAISMHDPFGAARSGLPGDPMENVLSLQTYAAAVDYNYNSTDCKTVGDTASCGTNRCTTVGTTSSCNTTGCEHTKVGVVETGFETGVDSFAGY